MDFKNRFADATDDDLLEMRNEIDRELAARKASPVKAVKPVKPAAPGPGGKILTYTDGASRGNPGHAGIGVLLFDEKDQKILQDFRYIGQCTNNEAEYRALLLALDRAYEVTQDTVECYMDSELVQRQVTGRYAVKSEKMAGFLAEVKQRIARFKKISFTHVPREHPRLQLADKLANRAIDEAKK